MFAKLEGLEKKYMELEEALAQPDVFNDQEHYRKLTKAHADLREIVDLFRRHRALQQEMAENKQLLHDEDPDIRDMAHEEIRRAESELPRIEQALKVALLPTDPLDEKNTILEIRAGTGGEEAALFAADLFRMYTRYAELQGWKVEIMSESPSESGGYKEIICLIAGDRVYSRLKFEAGTHRVQRVPATETQGRIHTSAATVAVMPEAEEVDGPKTCALIFTALPARAASTSTRRNPPCASPICPLTRWSPARMSAPSTKTRPGP